MCDVGAAVFLIRQRCVKAFRDADRAVLCCMLAFAALTLGFLSDSLLTRSQKTTIAVGTERITLYRDELPVSLDDLNVPLTGRYRSSSFSERKSPLLAYSRGADQSFNSTESAVGLDRLSYTVCRVGVPALVQPLLDRKIGACKPDDAAAAEWQADAACSLPANGGMLRFGNEILIWSASFALDTQQIRTLLEKLELPTPVP